MSRQFNKDHSDEDFEPRRSSRKPSFDDKKRTFSSKNRKRERYNEDESEDAERKFSKKRFSRDNDGERKFGKDRKFVEGVVCFLLKMIFGVKVKDANAPFRLMRRELVAKYIQRLPKDFNLPNIMFTTYFVYYGHKVLFLPISFKPRRKGKNSINPKKIMKIGWKAVGDFRRLRKEMKNA